MATIANGTGVFATLGYNFTDPNNDVIALSNSVISHLNVVPPLMQTWQAQDIANNSTSGYYQNPVSNDTIKIANTGGGIIFYSANVTSNNANTYTDNLWRGLSTTTLQIVANNFLDHTNRLSGVSDYNTDMKNGLSTYDKPYLQTAMAAGKAASYIVFQTDNIQNTAPMLGSFTSILVGPQINAASNLIVNYPRMIANSISIGVDPISGNVISVSNLSYTQVLQINNDVANTINLLSGRQTNDENFYINLQALNKKFSTVTQFNNMGETQDYLIKNFIGTPSLIAKINSANTSNS